MVDEGSLRALGRGGLAALIRDRPELLHPRPPASLQELVGRLGHPAVALAAMRRLDLPTLQVVQVLAALGERADRAGLLRLLGIASDRDEGRAAEDRADGERPDERPDADGLAAVDRAVATLRDRLLLQGGYRLVPQVRALWPAPLGLADTVEAYAVQRTVEELRTALTLLGHRADGRKPELVARLATALDDGPRVRALLEHVPPLFRKQLLAVAHGRLSLDRYALNARAWNSAWNRHGRAAAEDPQQRPVEWAMARFLLVPVPGGYDLAMPAEVALALRGEGWTAALAPHPPAVTWEPRPAAGVTDAALAAASGALRTVGAVLASASRSPVVRLKAGAVGVRELRRLATEVGAATGDVRLALALAHELRLLDVDDLGFVPTVAFDGWQRRPAAVRYALLTGAWSRLASVPLLEPEAAWNPQAPQDGARPARGAVLAALAEHPGAAPAQTRDLVRLLQWQVPLLLGTMIHSSTGATGGQPDDEVDGEGLAQLVRAVLAETAWLGLTGTDALSPAGAALACGGDVAAAVGDGLGTTHRTARLQGDLTAVVLGEPDAELAAALDLMADREDRSAASVWRFSPASVRRAMDAGDGADDLLRRLADLAENAVPQPLEYLVHDVARRHGSVRGRAVACYLRCDDEPLLTELVADRRLRSLGLARIAPTIAVGAHPWPKTLDALRAAGYAPTEEDAAGGTVVTGVLRHRASGAPDAVDEAKGSPQPDPEAVAEAVLAAPDHAAGMLIDTGRTMLDLRHGDDVFQFYRD